MLDFSKRETKILILGLIFVILFLGYQLGVEPVFKKRNDLARILSQKQIALEEMFLLQQKFFAISNSYDGKIKGLSNRNKNFSLFSFLDLKAQQSDIKENVVYMKPFTKKIADSLYVRAIVKIKLNEVYLKEFIDFLYLIESSKNGINITSLSLSKAGKNKKKLDAIIETQTLVQKEKA